MLDHLRSLAVFAKVAELGSFRAAARAFSLSPSVVSHHVSELETHLALPLLYRSTRRLSLTPDGEQLLGAALEMVGAAERGLDGVNGRSGTLSGVLRLTAPAFLADTDFCRDLAAFASAHPNVRMGVSFTDAPRDLLRDGLDLAVRIGRLQDSTHKTRRLAEMRRVLVCSPGYLATRPRAKKPQDFRAWDFVHLSSRPAEVTLVAAGRRSVSVALTPKVSVDSVAAMRGLVLSGAGIAALPEVKVRGDLASGDLVELLSKWRLPVLGVHAVWPHNAQRAELTRRFLEFMGERVRRLFEGPRIDPGR